jgi:hypothetical protein
MQRDPLGVPLTLKIRVAFKGSQYFTKKYDLLNSLVPEDLIDEAISQTGVALNDDLIKSKIFKTMVLQRDSFIRMAEANYEIAFAENTPHKTIEKLMNILVSEIENHNKEL